MANLTPASAQAIARLRSYVPPPTSWSSLPLSRKAAVLVLLFADRRGDLRVVLTIRASTMKNYAGQAALPGGKSDLETENPFQTARREAHEEIGLPLYDSKLPHPFRVEHLTEQPCQLAYTNLGVRPCIAFLSANRSTATSSQSPTPTSSDSNPNVATLDNTTLPDVETTLIPRLSAHEVAAVFTAPFRNFLQAKDDTGDASWYQGHWQEFHGTRWKMHNFFVPITRRNVAVGKVGYESKEERERRMGDGEGSREGTRVDRKENGKEVNGWNEAGGVESGVRPDATSKGKRKESDEEEGKEKEKRRYTSQQPTVDRIIHPENKFRVFGLTARILVDAARVAYAEEPEFEANEHNGDEEIIARLLKQGYLRDRKKDGEESVRRLAKF
ncbi:MAG: hypothetical protein M1820_006430 [Bogoriella megaspora]|nr:MAG: hypothetical protein M1820_006430 [Bogoriella megaspora]